MSKRDLKKYVAELTKKQLEEQVLDLYARFKEVKVYYDFVFNPKEEKLIEECKFKINREYFPAKGRRAKTRRSVAQKCIKHFKQLGVDYPIIIEIMLFNLNTAQRYSARRKVYDTFYRSMIKSFEELVDYVIEHNMQSVYKEKINNIIEIAWEQDWINKSAFEDLRF
ncbi:MAG: hypothetical protein KAG64_06600 [Bacteroidales bacterium]|nr:hypothetical protein [Bacteroidales bacterium]